jgi:hypothetical protein
VLLGFGTVLGVCLVAFGIMSCELTTAFGAEARTRNSGPDLVQPDRTPGKHATGQGNPADIADMPTYQTLYLFCCMGKPPFMDQGVMDGAGQMAEEEAFSLAGNQANRAEREYLLPSDAQLLGLAQSDDLATYADPLVALAEQRNEIDELENEKRQYLEKVAEIDAQLRAKRSVPKPETADAEYWKSLPNEARR